MPRLYTDNATTTLASGISDSATALNVAAAAGALFPNPTSPDYFMATIESGSTREIVKVTARATDAFTIERAQEGTTAQTWSAGATVALRVTAGAMTALESSAMREIATVTTTGSQSTITFSSIPSTYRDLLVVLSGRGTAAVTAVILRATLNGDSGANYSFVRENRFGATTDLAATYMEVGTLSAASTANYVSTMNFWLRDYAATGKWRPSMAQSTAVDGTTAVHQQASGWWENTADPVSSMAFALASGSFEDGSTATLYGMGAL